MRAKRCDGTNRSDREQGQPNEWRRRYSLQSRSGPCSRTPSGPAVHADCINRPDRRLHPTHHLIITLCLQRGSHPQTPFAASFVKCRLPTQGQPFLIFKSNVWFCPKPPCSFQDRARLMKARHGSSFWDRHRYHSFRLGTASTQRRTHNSAIWRGRPAFPAGSTIRAHAACILQV